jgi:hypothetical protein
LPRGGAKRNKFGKIPKNDRLIIGMTMGALPAFAAVSSFASQTYG